MLCLGTANFVRFARLAGIIADLATSEWLVGSASIADGVFIAT